MHILKAPSVAWPVWLSWSGAVPQNERLQVLFLIGAHAWFLGSVLVGVCVRGNQLMFLSHTDVSLSPFLPPFPSL